MVAHGGEAFFRIDLEKYLLAHLNEPRFYPAHMEDGIAQALGIVDAEATGGAGGRTNITHLTALFGIEAGAIDHYGAGVACLECAGTLDLVVGDIAKEFGGCGHTLVLE